MTERTHRTKRQTLRARDLRRTTTATEKKLWVHLRSGKTGASFRRQHPVGSRYADYYCVALKLAVEVDGPWHDEARDAARDVELAALGVTTLRFSVQEIDEEMDGVVERIRLTVWEMGHA